jgi:5-(carboxyamino)imidazole ribonucleotide synthase
MILPGATVGVLGGGQLGRMLALAARRMGYRVHVLSPESNSPAGQAADRERVAPYSDLEAVREFAQSVSVVTLEFENVPTSTVEEIASFVPVRPGRAALQATQHRLREKTFLQRAGFPVSPFRAISSRAALNDALREVRPPAVLKTAGFGYDGKGQTKIVTQEETEAAWSALGGNEAVLEAWVDFVCEVSVVATRGLDGAFVHYGTVQNTHRNHILDLTAAPSPVPVETAREAVEIARSIFEELSVVGTACVEFFLKGDGQLFVNEVAPRPHNSGHWTIDAAITSQFEQQLRAVCGLPLGSTYQLRPAVMANLLGDLWSRGEPDWARALASPGVKLHLYGKREARPGRKMGHVTALGETAEEARTFALGARHAVLSSPSSSSL